MTQRNSRFPLEKNELYFWDADEKVFKPTVGSDGMLPIQSIQKKWKDSFTMPTANALNTENWEVTQVGAGHSVNVVNGELQLVTGVTPNTETILTSKETFSDPFRALFGLKLSQKIINQGFYVEAISVDKVTKEPDGLHAVAWRLSADDITTVTSAVYETQNGGLARLASPATAVIVSQTANFGIYELELFADEVWYHTRVLDSTNGRSFSAVRQQQIPDPNAIFKIRIRALNKAVAPVSSTTFSFQFVTVIDYAELTAEITSGRGNISAGQGIATTIAGGSLPVVTTVSTVTTANIVPKMLLGTITASAISVATPFTSTAIDGGTTLLYSNLRFRVIFDQPVKIDVYHGSSATLTSNKIQATYNIPANTPTIIDERMLARYIGVKITNTGVATTTIHECLYALMGLS